MTIVIMATHLLPPESLLLLAESPSCNAPLVKLPTSTLSLSSVSKMCLGKVNLLPLRHLGEEL